MQIGIIGAGNVGGALARLALAAGRDVRVGVQGEPDAKASPPKVGVREAAAFGELVLLALPYHVCATALPPLADALAGRIVVDVTNPVRADWSPLPLGEGNAAALEIARLLPGARVVKAFNTVFADAMTPERLVRTGGARTTAFIAGDDADAVATVAVFAESLGFSPQPVGALARAALLEAVAHLNIAIALAGGGTDAAFVYDRRSA
ncbi:MAG: NADPH-dependent F420 reductase [Lysobacteraceae bacterium]